MASIYRQSNIFTWCKLMEVGEILWEQAHLHQQRIWSIAITHRHRLLAFKLQPQGQYLCAHDLNQTSHLKALAILYCQVCFSSPPMCHVESLHCHDSSSCPCAGDALHTTLMAAYLSWYRSTGWGELPSLSNCSAAQTRTYSGRQLEPSEIWSSRIQPTR